VAGSVLGDGAASNGQIRGAAPKSRLFFQSLLDDDGGLGGLPFTLDELFEEAYHAGARIHNNSWGAATSSTYRIASSEVDAFVHRRKDMLIVISAGNEGSAADPAIGTRNAAKGYVDWLSIGSPATCKNALTVGASRSARTEGGYATLTYGELRPQSFPTKPTAAALVSGDPEAIGAFSSRGPCDDYRIKPDLVAPGTDILSCRSSNAPLANFWGPYPANNRYAFMGGTSMAAPLVSGCAALIREYYVKSRQHQPSAALLKATLINGTVKLSAEDAVADFPDLPNYHQGFGAVHLPSSIPTPRNANLRLEFVDNWADTGGHFTMTGRRARFRIGVAGGRLRLCLAYTDAPGRGVQNNLDLLLEIPGEMRKRFGNEKVPRGFNAPDPNNNVEAMTIDNAPAGDYLIVVVATNILKPPQDFALVVTGQLTTPLRAE
jgi:subtilisin family serine protease